MAQEEAENHFKDHITSKRAEEQQTEMEEWLNNHKLFTLFPTANSIVDAPANSTVKCIQWKKAGPKKPEHGIPDVSR